MHGQIEVDHGDRPFAQLVVVAIASQKMAEEFALLGDARGDIALVLDRHNGVVDKRLGFGHNRRRGVTDMCALPTGSGLRCWRC